MSQKHYDHAIVIGGSIAGLLTARVLADHAAQVTVIERDAFPDAPEVRTGLPHGRHLHVLLLRGYEIFSELFPGLSNDLVRAGAPPMDYVRDAKRYAPGVGWSPRFDSGFQVTPCSRSLLDWCLRQHVQAIPNIAFVQRQEVTRLHTDPTAREVRGVWMRERGAADQEGSLLQADLVVDVSGRTSRTPSWLEQIGYPTPAENLVDAHLGYATRWYAPPANFDEDWKLLMVLNAPPAVKRGGVIMTVENGQWMTCVLGGGYDYPPTDEEDFLRFAQGLHHPAIAEMLQRATPLSPIIGYRKTSNQFRRYDRLRRWPARFFTLGDAVCALNPFYGQGMTVAGLGAQLLGRFLAQQPAHPGATFQNTHTFQRQLAAMLHFPWLMATGADFRYPGTTGKRARNPLTNLAQAYMDRAWVVAGANTRVYQAFLKVMNMVAAPAVLFHPAVIYDVLTQRADTIGAEPAVPTTMASAS